jgi:hypothetical protein
LVSKKRICNGLQGGWSQVRGSFVTSQEASHKEDDVSMVYLKDCTKRETLFNGLQYLEADLK